MWVWQTLFCFQHSVGSTLKAHPFAKCMMNCVHCNTYFRNRDSMFFFQLPHSQAEMSISFHLSIVLSDGLCLCVVIRWEQEFRKETPVEGVDAMLERLTWCQNRGEWFWTLALCPSCTASTLRGSLWTSGQLGDELIAQFAHKVENREVKER